MNDSIPYRRHGVRGFSLIELLVVMGILAFLLVLSAPTMQSTFRGSKLTQAGDQLRNHLALAQQTAVKENVGIEIHLYKTRDKSMPGDEEYVTAYQMYSIKINPEIVDNPAAPPLREKIYNLYRLPQGVVLSELEEQSSLLKSEYLQSQDLDKVRGLDGGEDVKDVPYFSFQFRPDGSLALKNDGKERYFFTLMTTQTIRAGNQTKPDDYICLQIDPSNGQVKWYQPNL